MLSGVPSPSVGAILLALRPVVHSDSNLLQAVPYALIISAHRSSPS